MIYERCSCGAKFETNEPEFLKLWREWRRKHICTETIEPGSSTANTTIETLPIGFAPQMHPGRQDPALDE